jgi:hypothetical protein
MERDFLAAIGKEQQHPHKEEAGAEESGMLPASFRRLPRCVS